MVLFTMNNEVEADECEGGMCCVNVEVDAHLLARLKSSAKAPL